MAWDEWEQLKAGARLRLASASEEAGGPQAGASEAGAAGAGAGAAGGLRHSMRQWTAAAAVAGDLQGSMSTALGRLGKGHDGVRNRTELQHHGLSTGMDGLDSADTLRAVLATWDKRLAAIQDECGWLESALRRTGRDLTGTDAGVRATVDAVKVPAQAEGR